MFLALCALAGLYGMHLAQLQGLWPGQPIAPERQGYLYVPVFLGAGGLILHLARRTAQPTGWRLVGLGTLLWGLGQLTFATLQQNSSAFSAADPFFLSLPVFFLLAFRRFEQRWFSPAGLPARLDVAALVMGLGGYLWYFLVAHVLLNPAQSALSNAVAAIYPLSDMLLVTLLLAQAWRGMSGAPRGLWPMALGLLCFIGADLGFAELTLRGAYTGAQWPDALWPLAALLFAGAAWQATQDSGDLPEDSGRLPAHVRLVPYLALGGSFALSMTLAEHGSLAARGAIYATLAVAFLVAARQTVALRELEDSRAQLHHQAHHDPLTGLGNRAQLETLLNRALAGEGEVGLLFVDLDDFKFVNDALGHRAGDQLLQEVAGRLRAALGPGQACIRLGGDEFVLLLGNADPARLEALSTRVIQALREPVGLTGQQLQITASIGAALSTPQQRDPAALLRWADQAMYEVKRTGKNALNLYIPGMHDQLSTRRMLIESRLRGVVGRQELCLHYQPQQEQDGQQRRFEALLRWTEPELGAVSPGEFVPIAEMAGLMVALDNWVVDEACRQLAAWLPAFPDRQVAVNISPPHLVRPDFLPGLRATLERHGVPPQALELEVTERLLIEHAAQSHETLRSLLALGVNVAIDDFGVGQSSLSALLRLPISTLKIDQAFTRELGLDTADTAQTAYTVVQAIVALGQALNLRVVAEGVETAGQAQLLRRLGVDALQGSWIGRAQPPGALRLAAATLGDASPELA